MGRVRIGWPGSAVILVIAIGAAGCAEDADPPASTTPTPATVAPTAPVDPMVRAEQSVVGVSLTQDGTTMTGTGVVLTQQGHVVVSGAIAEADEGAQATVTVAGGEPQEGTVRGGDPRSGVALITVDPTPALVPAVLSERTQIEIGEPVALMSAPPGQDPRRIPGEVAVDAQLMPELGLALIGISLEAEVDVAGTGPLIDDAGEVVGLLGFASVGADGAQTPLAIPAPVVARIADQLLTTGEVVYPVLGVSVEDAPGGGAVVSGVAADGPAAQADLRVDDVITAIDDRAITVAADVVLELQARVVGDEVTVTYLRDGVEARTTATLAAASTT